MSVSKRPKYLQETALIVNSQSSEREALQRFFEDVQSGAFPAEAEAYHMDEETARRLRDSIRNEELE